MKKGRGTHVVLLSGGSGSRLWPLSNDVRSKQFLKVLRDDSGNHVSMVQRTYAQLRRNLPGADVTVATCASQASMLAEQIGGGFGLVVEPERRDTAPAILLTAAHLAWEQGADQDDAMVVMPIDSFVEDAYYDRLADVADAVRARAAEIVLLGVEPTYPSEKYGYIVPSAPSGSPRQVESFREKPDAETAASLIARGALWNCCVFGMTVGHALEVLAGYGEFSGFRDLRERYAELPRNSFDYEVVERASSVAVVPYGGAWKDLGTWNTLCEEMADDVAGPVVVDASCRNVHVIDELGVPIVISGIEDAVVVATEDGILVCAKEGSAGIKPLVARAEELA